MNDFMSEEIYKELLKAVRDIRELYKEVEI